MHGPPFLFLLVVVKPDYFNRTSCTENDYLFFLAGPEKYYLLLLARHFCETMAILFGNLGLV